MGVSWVEVLVVWSGIVVTIVVALDSVLKKIPWRNRFAPTDPVKWYFFSYFVWFIALPVYLLHRRHILRSRHEAK